MLQKSNALYQPKSMGCIPIEAVCFFHGVVNCVLSMFGIVTLTLARILLEPRDVIEGPPREMSDAMFQEGFEILSPDIAYASLDREALPLTRYGVILYAFCIGSFVFSLLLCYGIHKRSPAYLRAYLVYGVTVTTLMLVTIFYLYAWLTDHITHSVTVMGVVFCMYLLVLRMVQRTHQLFCAEQRHLLPHLEDFMKHS
ncbi:uncharacterized protein LOC133525414 [Cydia pomonella]|uniref:uncharacterized protein LOC133525414 n=1 Tax=Cydia pomonella TaxID=82600 RepID=UPI002ADD6E48|nr:uncharacterized protein LOC133525414 [Cydia pomonella]